MTRQPTGDGDTDAAESPHQNASHKHHSHQRRRPSWAAVLDLGAWTPEMSTRALRAVQRVPRPLLDAGAAVGARVLGRWPNGPMRQWQRNAEVASGRRPDVALTRSAARLWARNMLDSARLRHWTPARLQQHVTMSDADWQRLSEAFHTTGAVLALPHLGSWDIAGAWACSRGLPVTSVAERMHPAEFAFFAAEREALGMRILAHDDPRLGEQLLADQRDGRMVCLLMDRDLSRWGTRVQWPAPTGPHSVRVPNGAVRIALETGATLFAVTSHYTRTGVRLRVSDPIRPHPGAGRVLGMCQQIVDVFAREVAEHPDDWHMLVPFFPEAARRDAAPATDTGSRAGASTPEPGRPASTRMNRPEEAP